jgi:hypothetical protein
MVDKLPRIWPFWLSRTLPIADKGQRIHAPIMPASTMTSNLAVGATSGKWALVSMSAPVLAWR